MTSESDQRRLASIFKLIREQTEEITRLRVDAARYQLLRAHGCMPLGAESVNGGNVLRFEMLDGFVDRKISRMESGEAIGSSPLPPEDEGMTRTEKPTDHIDFYEREFYPLSNFSAFQLRWKDRLFQTSEAAYQWEKFPGNNVIQRSIQTAFSAHDAFKFAEYYRRDRRGDWDYVKLDIMRDILRAKASQHEYVRRKLLETGDRELIECSWRDDFWGWGPRKDGMNMLGKLWMEVREEIRKGRSGSTSHDSGAPVIAAAPKPPSWTPAKDTLLRHIGQYLTSQWAPMGDADRRVMVEIFEVAFPSWPPSDCKMISYITNQTPCAASGRCGYENCAHWLRKRSEGG